MARLLLALLLGAMTVLPGCGEDSEASMGNTGIEPNPSPKGDKDPNPDQHLGPDASTPPPDGAEGTVGAPAVCQPDCHGRQCGPDGCGGACGWCADGHSCQSGACVDADCEPACAGEMIGADDGCGGVCTGSGITVGLKPGGAQNAALFRSQVLQGLVPLPQALPLTGWLNEHGATLPAPLTDRRVTVHAMAAATETTGEPLVTLQLGLNSGLDAATIAEADVNLVVVVDVSASMAATGRLDFAKAGLVALLDQLDGDDRLAVVSYSRHAQVVMPPTAVTDTAAFISAIESLRTDGGTNLAAGLELGLQQAALGAGDDRLSHVLLVSDGLSNEGQDPSPWAATFAGQGVGLTTLGVGGDVDFDLLLDLAVRTGGNFYFLDAPDTLATVFTDELTWLMTPLADDLEIWFTLPENLGVEAVYGFEYALEGDTVRLLGPSPVVGGPDPGAPAGPVAASSTLHASREAGLLMVQLQGDLDALANSALTTLGYRYRWVASGEVETFEVPVQLGPASPLGGGAAYLSNAAAQRGLCVLRAGLALKQTAVAVHDDAGLDLALAELAGARDLCAAVAGLFDDPQIDDDLALIDALMESVCGNTCP